MTRRAHHKTLKSVLFPERTPVSLDECVSKFVDLLLTDRTPKDRKKEPLIDQLFKFVELSDVPMNEEGDVLTTLILGFAPDDLPKFTPNCCKTLGDTFEAMIRMLYKAAYPNHYSTDFSEMEARLDKMDTKLKGKWRPEFLVYLIAIELKYRAANGQGKTEQSKGALILKELGFEPVMLFLRVSPNAKAYGNGGWDNPEGNATIRRIKEETGIDIIELLERVAEDPRIAARRKSGLRSMFKRETCGCLNKLMKYGKEMLDVAPNEMNAMRRHLNDLMG
jgi:hypothetical protein